MLTKITIEGHSLAMLILSCSDTALNLLCVTRPVDIIQLPGPENHPKETIQRLGLKAIDNDLFLAGYSILTK